MCTQRCHWCDPSKRLIDIRRHFGAIAGIARGNEIRVPQRFGKVNLASLGVFIDMDPDQCIRPAHLPQQVMRVSCAAAHQRMGRQFRSVAGDVGPLLPLAAFLHRYPGLHCVGIHVTFFCQCRVATVPKMSGKALKRNRIIDLLPSLPKPQPKPQPKPKPKPSARRAPCVRSMPAIPMQSFRMPSAFPPGPTDPCHQSHPCPSFHGNAGPRGATPRRSGGPFTIRNPAGAAQGL